MFKMALNIFWGDAEIISKMENDSAIKHSISVPNIGRYSNKVLDLTEKMSEGHRVFTQL